VHERGAGHRDELPLSCEKASAIDHAEGVSPGQSRDHPVCAHRRDGAVHELKRKGGRVVGLVNVISSSITRECGSGMFLHAGPEFFVAATKSFTNTGVALALLALELGRVRDLSLSEGRRLVNGLADLPARIGEILAAEDDIAAIAARYAEAEHMFSSAECAAGRSPGKARRNSRRSPTSTQRRTSRPNSNTDHWR
jgi:hypothetical protein